MLAQALYFGFRIGEVTCPTRYFDDASSINFRRSVKYGFGVLETALQFRLAKLGLHVPRFLRENGRRLDDPRTAPPGEERAFPGGGATTSRSPSRAVLGSRADRACGADRPLPREARVCGYLKKQSRSRACGAERLSRNLQQLVGAGERFERARVRPPARQDVVRQIAARDVGVVDVGDLQLAARGRPQRLDHVEHVSS